MRTSHDGADMRREGRLTLGVWLILFWLGLVLSEYQLTLLTYVGLSGLITMGLAVLTGHAGLSSFGQMTYAALGAYASAILTQHWGISPWASLPLVLIAAMAISYAGALLTVSLGGHYLPLATIAFGVSAYYLIGALPMTGGYSGFSDISPLSLPGLALTNAWQVYLLVAISCALAMFALRNLIDSRVGRALRAVSRGRQMPEAMGVDTRAIKAMAFVIACMLATLSGWFYAHFQRFLSPTPFSLNQGIEYVFMSVIGGAGSLWGALIGSGLVTLIKPYLQKIMPALIGFSGNFEIVVFGSLVIVLFQIAPEGLMPALCRWAGREESHARPLPVDAGALAVHHRSAPGTETLRASGVTKQFGGLVASADIDMSLHAGEILALIGPNGAGKSTFFSLLSGLEPMDRGDVIVMGQSIRGLSSRAIGRLGLSRTFQHVRLIPTMSVIENVALGAHARGRAGALRAMTRLDREEEGCILAEAYRQLARVGLQEHAWAPAGTLALGQQRIVEIARALATDPHVLLLDEPAAGLRHHEKQALAATLDGLRREGLAILLVEHDMPFVMTLCNRVIVLDYGRKIAEGSPEAVRENPRVREAYLGVGA